MGQKKDKIENEECFEP